VCGAVKSAREVLKSPSADTTFKADVLDFFTAFNNLMTKNNPNLVGAQTLALKVSLSSWPYFVQFIV
jgi:hypothetical protein